MSAGSAERIQVQVHARGEGAGVDGILRLIDESTRAAPLDERLRVMCRELAQITNAEVASVYVRERGPDGDVMVMRGNVGFPITAIGVTKLRVGEGLTGFVAECLRPVSAAIASDEQRYKHICGLGEKRFPAFLGVPLMDGSECTGVLVMQRRNPRFASDEVVLATALAAPFVAALRDARERAKGGSGRSVCLRGVPVVDGEAMGRVRTMPTLSSLHDVDADPATDPAEVALASLDQLSRDLASARESFAGIDDPDVTRALSNLALVLSDARFRARVEESTAQRGLLDGLTRVARDYARVPYLVGSRRDFNELLDGRATEVEDLCVLIYGRVRRRPVFTKGSILAARRIGAFAALCAVSRRVGAIVVEEGAKPSTSAIAIARAASMPFVSDVAGLFAWVRHDDLVVVNATKGNVEINPSASTVARTRNNR